MNFKPLGDRVLVQQLDAKDTTESGLYIPDDAKKKPTRGNVVAVGAGHVLDDGTVRKPEIKVGDQVLFGDYSGSKVELEGEEYVIMREEDVLAIVEE